jgi:hypothetical protein
MRQPQTPAPLHRLGGLQAVSRSPFGTKPQVPMLPDRLQLRQVSVQASLQHTPSAQKPDLHSFAAAQVAPASLRAAHAPPAQ